MLLLLTDKILAHEQNYHHTYRNKSQAHPARPEFLHLSRVIVTDGVLQNIVKHDPGSGCLIAIDIIKPGREDLAIHNHTDNEDDGYAQDQCHGCAFENFLDDPEVNLDFDLLLFLSHKVVVHPQQKILNITDDSYDHKHDHVHVPLKTKV